MGAAAAVSQDPQAVDQVKQAAMQRQALEEDRKQSKAGKGSDVNGLTFFIRGR